MQYGGDLEAQDVFGNTPLFYVTNKRCLRVLVEGGSSLSHRNKEGKNIIDILTLRKRDMMHQEEGNEEEEERKVDEEGCKEVEEMIDLIEDILFPRRRKKKKKPLIHK